MGVDTVKLSYPLDQSRPGWKWVQEALNNGWKPGKNYGTKGALWYCERVHEDGTRVVVKGVGHDAHLIFEQSAPKFLGIAGAMDPRELVVIDRHLRSITDPTLPKPFIRRLDLTHDVVDPENRWIDAAKGWRPHARARYTEAEYLDPATDGRTVWLHNKSRGVRVYDKEAETRGEPWARDLTRIEYQVRGDWCQKLYIDRLYEDLPANVERALSEVVRSLGERVRA